MDELNHLEASVIIPAWNAEHSITQQLLALSNQNPVHNFEVIIVDDGSTDETVKATQSFSNHLKLRVIGTQSHGGVSHARNTGARVANSNRLLFCDADDIVSNNWVHAMVSSLNEATIIGGFVDTYVLNDPLIRSIYGTPCHGLPTSMNFLPYAVGCNFGIHRDVYQDLGGCDESFVGGHEEVDLCWRAQLEGYSIVFATDAVVHYRLRSRALPILRSRWRCGRTYTKLYHRWSLYITEKASLRREVALLVWTLREAFRIRNRRDWLSFLYFLAWDAGRRGMTPWRAGPDDSKRTTS